MRRRRRPLTSTVDDVGRQRRRQRGPLRMVGVAQHHACAAVGHLHSQHAGALLHVERHHGETRGQRAIEERHVLRAVAEQQGDPVARLEPGSAQSRRRGGSATHEVTVGPCRLATAQSHLAGVASSRGEQQVDQGCVHDDSTSGPTPPCAWTRRRPRSGSPNRDSPGPCPRP